MPEHPIYGTDKSVFVFVKAAAYAGIEAWGILAVAAENRHLYIFGCLYEQSFHGCGAFQQRGK
jgi:hypothetical protein